MARIADAELSRLKRDVPIAQLIEGSGVKLEQRGGDLVGLCPFHDDREPSLVVTPSKGLWHCLGACRTGGSVIDWVMKRDGVSFRRAVDALLELHPSPTTSADAAALAFDVDDQALLDQVCGYYHRTLLESPEAIAYLESRGLFDRELVETFKLGYANRTLGYRLPAKFTKVGAEVKERLQRVGILRDSGHEHLNGSLVVPILDENGHVRSMYGRKITEAHSLRKGTPLHLYLPGPHADVFNVAAFQSPTIILCEALIDALTFWRHGFSNVTSAYGVEGLTDELFSRLVQCERVLIAYDHDEAGERAAAAHAERLVAAGVEVARVVFPKGMDANSYAQKLQPAARALKLALEQAVPMAPVKARPVVVDAEPKAAAKEESQQPAASTLAAAASSGGDVVVTHGDRTWRARGLEKNLTRAALRCTLFVQRGEQLFVDALDLYAAKARAHFLREAARELVLDEDLLKKDLARVMLHLEDDVERRLREVAAPAPVAMTADDEAAALALLKDPHLLDHVLSDLEKCGVVGEETNKLIAYLSMTSRKLDDPLAVVIQSSSAAGKSSLLEAVLSFCPDEDLQKYSAMTGQSLYYMSGTSLQHKVLAVAEEEGAERASYALKLLQSEGELVIASTGKDERTGKHVTHEYKVEGPVAIMLTTTSVDVDEELLNRCLVLSVDEERAQTRAIHDAQRRRRTLEGVLSRAKKTALRALHQNAQRLLRPIHVVNPYAHKLAFRDDKTRMRRDFPKYLGLIDAIAFVHQHQRKKLTASVDGSVLEYIEVTEADIERANALFAAVHGRSLDELPAQTRVVLNKLRAFVEERAQADAVEPCHVLFSRRQAREALGIGDTQLRVHMERLCALEFLILHRDGLRFVYELAWSGDIAAADTTGTSRGEKAALAGVSRGTRGPLAGHSRGPVDDDKPASDAQTAHAAPLSMLPYVAKDAGKNGAARKNGAHAAAR
jgi:DNA primase